MAISRRNLLVGGGAAAVVVAAGTFGLVEEDVLPGKGRIDRLMGACGSGASVPTATVGPVVSGQFHSTARRGIEVGWSVAYPPGASVGAALPVCVTLHGRGATHGWMIDELSLPSFLAEAVDRHTSPPFAIASVDGGDATNWHRRANGDDPAAMVTDEFVPLLAEHGLETSKIGLWGWSLGGLGALLLASTLGSGRTAAVVASSPALWTSYAHAEPGVFDSPSDFAAHDVFARTGPLDQIPLRIDCGTDDPFAANTKRLRAELTPTPAGGVTAGCHDDAFWTRQAAAQIAFLGHHLS